MGVNFQKNVHLYPDLGAQNIQMEVTNYGKYFSGEVELCFPNGWKIDQAKKEVTLNGRGSSQLITYKLTPTAQAKSGLMGPLVHQNKKSWDRVYAVQKIEYNHIPKQYIAQPSEAKLVRLELTVPKKKVGYLMGAGDLVPTYLEAIGQVITPIDIDRISQEELNQFDTVLVGIRAFNVLESLSYKNQLLFDFAQQGGTLIVQYNTSRRMQTKEILPYPIQLSRDRVTDENSPVRLINPQHPVLNQPHQITSADFDGWVQERGLYFANQWDERFIPILGMQDEGESEKQGSLLIAPYGQGKVVYTGLVFFENFRLVFPGPTDCYSTSLPFNVMPKKIYSYLALANISYWLLFWLFMKSFTV